MVRWESEFTSSKFDEKSATTNMISGRSGTRDSAGDTLSFSKSGGNIFGFGATTYSVVGLNVGSIDPMREQIRTYCGDIEKHINQIDPKADADMAFKSDLVQAAVSDYVEKVKTYCINLTSQLLAFSDKLADVKAVWEAGASNISDSVKNSNAAFDAGSKYTESMQ